MLTITTDLHQKVKNKKDLQADNEKLSKNKKPYGYGLTTRDFD